jgi:hypothetical protein
VHQRPGWRRDINPQRQPLKGYIMVASPTADRRAASRQIRVAFVLLVTLAALLATASLASATKLKGSIQLTTGSNTAPYTGSWVRLYQTALGPSDPAGYFVNPSSPAADQSYTPLVNGTQGVELNAAQPIASPAFDGSGNSLTNTILTPEAFAGVNFSAYVTKNTAKKAKFGKKGLILQIVKDSNVTDPISSADFTGWTIAWGGDPNYATPGSTPDINGGNLTGSVTWLNAKKHKLGGTITLNWSSTISEPPFQAYTAVWQLEGTYTP